MDVDHIAKLANLKLNSNEEAKFAKQFTDTLSVVDQMSELDTSKISPTSQVTNLINVTREDAVDLSRILPQSAALSQAKQVHNGYFVVPAILDA